MAVFFVVATPIGNLKDITLRAIETLKSVDIIVVEDTRVTKKILAHLFIHKPIIAYHKYSPQKIEKKIIDLLAIGKDIALVTDAGTPGISDPGHRLMRAINNALPSCNITPIPGPSSVTAMVSISNIDCREFIFLGFPPPKKGRKKFFERVASSQFPVILFESPHRIHKTLLELTQRVGDHYCNIGRELTKFFEEIFRGSLSDALEYFRNKPAKGEFVIIIDLYKKDHYAT